MDFIPALAFVCSGSLAGTILKANGRSPRPKALAVATLAFLRIVIQLAVLGLLALVLGEAFLPETVLVFAILFLVCDLARAMRQDAR